MRRNCLLLSVIMTVLVTILGSSFVGCTQKGIKPLTDDETAAMIEIALAHAEVSKWLETADVYSAEVGWSAVGWKDSKSVEWHRLEYEEIADGDLPPGRAYLAPLVTIHPDVHIRVGEPAGMHIHVAFDRETKEVVNVELMPGR